MLITTLPSLHNYPLIEEMLANPSVGGARYNIGMRSKYTPHQVLDGLKRVADLHGKKFWVDLKGRQLRIEQWAEPTYGDIVLNNEFEVDLPAKIIFRGGHSTQVVDYDKNRVYVSPDPKEAIGAGQAVNILGKNFSVKGEFLTKRDKEYISTARDLGIHDYMLSFVEKESDIEEVLKLDPDAKCVLKIESRKGLEYVANEYEGNHQLMAARDDLFENMGDDKADIISALELIIEKDPTAIAASHLFNNLPKTGRTGVADFMDLRLLQLMGYKNFMFSDGVSHRTFPQAMSAWENYAEKYLSEGEGNESERKK